jgi:hypothetical protein
VVAPKIEPTWLAYREESLRLQALMGELPTLSMKHRKLVAEIVMVRLFLMLENALSECACKVVCGSKYLDSTLPVPLVTIRTVTAAHAAMRSQGRPSPRRYLQWTKASEIRDNLATTLDSTDPFFATVSRHAAILSEMRKVRNHIAHKNASTHTKFRDVVRQYYGGPKRGVTPGVLLLTPGIGAPLLLERYLIAGRVFVKDIVRA